MADESFPSYLWLRAVLSPECTLDAPETVVLLALVKHAAPVTGEAYPSMGTLCAETRVSRSKVIRSLAELERRGVVRRERQLRGKTFGSNHYFVPLEPTPSVLQTPPSKVRPSVPETLGSVPQTLGVVSVGNQGGVSGTPQLLTELPNGTTHVTTQAPKQAKKRSPRKGSQRPVETSFPADWQPTEAHRAYALKHSLNLEFEIDGFRGWADGKTAVSWNGTFTTRLANAAKWDRTGGPRKGNVQRGVSDEVAAREWGKAGAQALLEGVE